MKNLPKLHPGDNIEVIAPASRCSDLQLEALKNLLTSWQLNCIVPSDIFGEDILCANTDEMRFKFLKKALQNPKTRAVICARGGYGSMQLIPRLTKLIPPEKPKLFVGMSDITALNCYLQQKWNWPVLHAAIATDKFSAQSIAMIKSILFGEIEKLEWLASPLNSIAKNKQVIESTITGGNLCLVQTSIGTLWQLEAQNKIIFLEEVSERGYRVDRMLEQLMQANIFKNAAAIVFGDFTGCEEADGSSFIQPVLERFAKHCEIPVVQIKGVGHGFTSLPLPLGTKAQLRFGKESKLICFR